MQQSIAAVVHVGILMVVIIAACATSPWAQENAQQRHDAVRALQPVGYWPADEGEGLVLHDRSGHGNHGSIHQVPWQEGLLSFTTDVYQWAQVPHDPERWSDGFSLGGWLFTRRPARGAGTLFVGQHFRGRPRPDQPPRWGGWVGVGTDVEGVMVKITGPSGWREDGTLVTILSGREDDVLGSAAEGVSIAVGEWQHILYTWEAGTGRLYVNSRLAHSGEDVPFDGALHPLVIGSDVMAWVVWPPYRRSLDGSVRDIVLFDRALTADEVAALHEATMPDAQPQPHAEEAVAEHGVAALRDAPPAGLLDMLQHPDLAQETRAEAALALAAMGPRAAEAVPALLETLEALTEADGPRPSLGLPRVEDFLRNAVMRALLDIAPDEAPVRDALGVVLAGPFLASLDLRQPYLEEVRELVRDGRLMDALDAYREHREALPELPGHLHWGYACPEQVREMLPLREERFDRFLSKGNPFSDGPYRPPGDFRPADYTPMDFHDGVAYFTTVERLSQAEVEAEFARSLQDVATEPPTAEAKWSRVKIVKIDADGVEQEALLEGPWLIFDGRDAKVDGWAIAADRYGYLHLVGGQHNRPRRTDWIPGSWERLGIAADDTRPQVMYWVSQEPGSIEDFEFVGHHGNPRTVPCGSMNYMNFARSPDGTLFLYGRDDVWTWGLYRYDTEARAWTGIGGSPVAMLASARETNPEWSGIIAPVNSTYGPSPRPVLVYAWQPGAYNFNRSSWGVRFDRTGRMHVNLGIRGVGDRGRIVDGPVYAWSDDLGDTFHRADGTPLSLPLTVNPVPGHHADLNYHSTRQWLDLWRSLLRQAGYSAP